MNVNLWWNSFQRNYNFCFASHTLILSQQSCENVLSFAHFFSVKIVVKIMVKKSFKFFITDIACKCVCISSEIPFEETINFISHFTPWFCMTFQGSWSSTQIYVKVRYASSKLLKPIVRLWKHKVGFNACRLFVVVMKSEDRGWEYDIIKEMERVIPPPQLDWPYPGFAPSA